MFSKETYIARRDRLKKQVGNGIIVLMGNEESSMNFKDNWYHFRQDSSFLYFCGINLPDLAFVLDTESGEEYIIGDELTMDAIVWTGPQPSIASLAEKAGVKNTKATSAVSELLLQAKNSGRAIHILPPYRPENKLKLAEWLAIRPNEINSLVSEKLIKSVVAQRSIKTAEEITEIEKAVLLTNKMHLTAMKMTREGMKESDIAGAVNEIPLSAGGQLSFPVILTKNGQILHNHYHGNTIQVGDMILCDCGAEVASGYAGDMTRTFPVGGEFTQRQKELYDIVVQSHRASVEALKPGVRFKDVHLLASKTLVEGLTDIGLMRGNAEEAVAAGAHTMFFQCGLGHMMGLDVHDMEDLGEQYVGYTDSFKKSTEFGLKSLRLGRELEQGFVLTVEPGIYIIPELIDMWKSEGKYAEFLNYDLLEKYKDFGGIRVEEDFVITKSGADLLGEAIPLDSADVENVRRGELVM